MALEPCRECKREVSTAAQKCPHCGVQYPTRSAAQRTVWSAVVAVVAVGAIFLFTDGFGAFGTFGSREFTVRITCTPGIPISGTYMTVAGTGASESHSIGGSCPATGSADYPARGSIVSAVVQKQDETGTLRLEILRGGDVIARSVTAAPYGVAQAASP